ncbi:MAG: hypothetical protein QW196_06755 [Sulfolobales archaeon]
MEGKLSSKDLETLLAAVERAREDVKDITWDMGIKVADPFRHLTALAEEELSWERAAEALRKAEEEINDLLWDYGLPVRHPMSHVKEAFESLAPAEPGALEPE